MQRVSALLFLVTLCFGVSLVHPMPVDVKVVAILNIQSVCPYIESYTPAVSRKVCDAKHAYYMNLTEKLLNNTSRFVPNDSNSARHLKPIAIHGKAVINFGVELFTNASILHDTTREDASFQAEVTTAVHEKLRRAKNVTEAVVDIVIDQWHTIRELAVLSPQDTVPFINRTFPRLATYLEHFALSKAYLAQAILHRHEQEPKDILELTFLMPRVYEIPPSHKAIAWIVYFILIGIAIGCTALIIHLGM